MSSYRDFKKNQRSDLELSEIHRIDNSYFATNPNPNRPPQSNYYQSTTTPYPSEPHFSNSVSNSSLSSYETYSSSMPNGRASSHSPAYEASAPRYSTSGRSEPVPVIPATHSNYSHYHPKPVPKHIDDNTSHSKYGPGARQAIPDDRSYTGPPFSKIQSSISDDRGYAPYTYSNTSEISGLPLQSRIAYETTVDRHHTASRTSPRMSIPTTSATPGFQPGDVRLRNTQMANSTLPPQQAYRAHVDNVTATTNPHHRYVHQQFEISSQSKQIMNRPAIDTSNTSGTSSLSFYGPTVQQQSQYTRQLQLQQEQRSFGKREREEVPQDSYPAGQLEKRYRAQESSSSSVSVGDTNTSTVPMNARDAYLMNQQKQQLKQQRLQAYPNIAEGAVGKGRHHPSKPSETTYIPGVTSTVTTKRQPLQSTFDTTDKPPLSRTSGDKVDVSDTPLSKILAIFRLPAIDSHNLFLTASDFIVKFPFLRLPPDFVRFETSPILFQSAMRSDILDTMPRGVTFLQDFGLCPRAEESTNPSVPAKPTPLYPNTPPSTGSTTDMDDNVQVSSQLYPTSYHVRVVISLGCEANEGDRVDTSITRRIRLLCGKKHDRHVLLGGGWNQRLDGGNPIKDRECLLATARRIIRCQSLIDLIEHKVIVLGDMYYHRPQETNAKGITFPEHGEVTRMFLCSLQQPVDEEKFRSNWDLFCNRIEGKDLVELSFAPETSLDGVSQASGHQEEYASPSVEEGLVADENREEELGPRESASEEGGEEAKVEGDGLIEDFEPWMLEAEEDPMAITVLSREELPASDETAVSEQPESDVNGSSADTAEAKEEVGEDREAVEIGEKEQECTKKLENPVLTSHDNTNELTNGNVVDRSSAREEPSSHSEDLMTKNTASLNRPNIPQVLICPQPLTVTQRLAKNDLSVRVVRLSSVRAYSAHDQSDGAFEISFGAEFVVSLLGAHYADIIAAVLVAVDFETCPKPPARQLMTKSDYIILDAIRILRQRDGESIGKSEVTEASRVAARATREVFVGACRWFDKNDVGFLSNQHLRLILHAATRFLSCDSVTLICSRTCCISSDKNLDTRLYYELLF